MIDPLNGLREKLSLLGAVSTGLVQVAPKNSRLAAVKDALAARLSFPEAPDQARREELYRLFSSWLSDPATRVSEDEWTQAPFVLLMGRKCLGDQPRFFEQVSKRVREEAQPRMLRRAIYAYLHDFSPEAWCLAAFASLLKDQIDRHQGAWAGAWKSRAAEPQRLFEPSGLPHRIAGAVCINGVPFRDVFRELGFTSELISHSGLHEPVARAILSTLASAFTSRTELKSQAIGDALSFLERDNKLRFVGLRVDIPNTLLAPFKDRVTSDAPVQASLTEFFARVYGSPRTSKAEWSGVSPVAISVMERWLVRKSLDLFFEVLNKTADGIWRFRRSFWLAHYREGLIEDAWPAFGKGAMDFIERDPAFARRLPGCARLSGAQSNQSVLLLKLPGLIVAEWSHAGACRVWKVNDPNAPSMFSPEYTGSDLRSDCSYAQSHHGTQGGTWQAELSGWIEDQTNVHIPMSKLMANTNA